MKKTFLPQMFLSLAIVISAAVTAQDGCEGWSTYCCKCAKCLVIDPPPALGTCRNCHLLCPNCRNELGDLNKAQEILRNKNRVLLERMKAYQSEANRHNSQLTDALVKTYGQESGHWTLSDPSSWRNLTMSGYNSSFGKFTVAAGNAVTSFGGGLGPGLLFNTLSTVQSSGFVEMEGNISQSVISILTDEGVVKVYTSQGDLYIAAGKLMNALRNNQPIVPAINRMNQEVKWLTDLKNSAGINKMASGISTIANLYGLVMAGADLFSNLVSVYDNYKARERNEAERKKLQEEIEKNVEMLQCMKETQDSLDHGGLGFKKSSRADYYAVNLLFGSLISNLSNNELSFARMDQYAVNEIFWDIDTIRVKAALPLLKQEDALLKKMITDFFEKVIPPLIPWILNRSKELSTSNQLKLLQMAKKNLGVLMADAEKIKSLSQSIIETLFGSVIGYQTDYVSGGAFLEIISPGQDQLPLKNENLTGNKWTMTPSEKIKGEFGRVNMDFPRNVEWRFEFFTADGNYIRSKTSDDGERSFDLEPGIYRIELNGVPGENIVIEKGKEARLKLGYLDIVSSGHWWVFDESKKVSYISDNKPKKLALPVGRYLLEFEVKPRSIRYYLITIDQGASVKFELPKGKLTDQ